MVNIHGKCLSINVKHLCTWESQHRPTRNWRDHSKRTRIDRVIVISKFDLGPVYFFFRESTISQWNQDQRMSGLVIPVYTMMFFNATWTPRVVNSRNVSVKCNMGKVFTFNYETCMCLIHRLPSKMAHTLSRSHLVSNSAWWHTFCTVMVDICYAKFQSKNSKVSDN